ncbi:MAG: trypsin-like peptidase domain-containing protein [Cyanothece sp. SIO1E1]|nr:trypsin-like peptidase domain-containing protein [Cyanothece sp. SIO1E1]
MGFEESKQAIAQIHYADSEAIAGTGFLVAKRYVLTCAHVVKSALAGEEKPMGRTLCVTFPFSGRGLPYPVEVVFYRFDENTEGADSAVLCLTTTEPSDVRSWTSGRISTETYGFRVCGATEQKKTTLRL